ncbi:MAG: bile acid:sodium symporter family protein [Bacteroidales bacterium]|nr:bile acid:sodium symporter family protein [Bacteroidales bacterium]
MLSRLLSAITRYMAVIVLVTALAAFLWPGAFSFIRTSWITPMLGLVMFGMGLTLEPGDFARVFARPGPVFTGVLFQFVLMPGIAWVLSRLFHLPPELTLGVLLVGCCPGGTSSNVICYLAKGDVALSVSMTMVSTLLSPVMTPLLVKLLAGEIIPVDFWSMFLSILEVIILPILLGRLFKRTQPKASEKATDFLPAFSSIVITLIVAAVVAASAGKLREVGLVVIAVVILHNLLGFALGYGAAKALRQDEQQARTISIEVGMQNSGLACSLVALHFASMPIAAVPGAVFSVWHNISGALLARGFARKSLKQQQNGPQVQP